MIDPQLESKIILITGANHGIGAATARAFVQQGARVFITAYRAPTPYSAEELLQARAHGVGGDALYRAMQQQPADALATEIRARGGQAAAHEADLADPSNIPKLFDLCEATFGPVDILVNNHTYCVLETFDPARITDEPGGIQLLSA